MTYWSERNSDNNLTRSAKRNFYDKLLGQLNDNISSKSDWWKRVNKCVNLASSSIPSLITFSEDNKKFHNDDRSKANYVQNDLFYRRDAC